MEKELKIAELATLWGVSVPTTWNRIKKMGLTTFIKKNESNKDINYVTISDEQINEFVVNVINNHNNPANNGYYEETLSNNNVVNNDNNIIDAEVYKPVQAFSPELMANLQEVFNNCAEHIMTVNNTNNERVDNVYKDYKNICDELSNHRANTILLEDKKASEGLYLNEIKELKKENETLNKDYNDLKLTNNNLYNEKENILKDYNELSEESKKEKKEKDLYKKIIIVGGVLFALTAVILAIFITLFITGNKDVNNVSEPVVNVQQEAQAVKPAPQPPQAKKTK